MTELKPCPFCGGKVHLETDLAQTKDPVFCFICDNCGAIVYMDDLIDKNKSIEAWNNRPSPWHTGTPSEIEDDEIWQWNYALVLHTDYDCIGNYLAGLLFRPNLEKGFFENDDIRIPFSEVVAWQRIEPYKEHD